MAIPRKFGPVCVVEEGWDLSFDTLAFVFTRSGMEGLITRPIGLSGYSVEGATSYLIHRQLRIIRNGSLTVAPVPEPGTLLLVGAGAILLGRRLRHSR